MQIKQVLMIHEPNDISQVLDALEQAGHTTLLRRLLQQTTDGASKKADHYRQLAKQHQKDGELEFDDNALVSLGEDNGAYVQAWFWIAD